MHNEYAQTGQAINKGHYREVLRRLPDADRRRRPTLHESGEWQLDYDNAPARASQQLLITYCIPQAQQPPWSPDVAPCELVLFPEIKCSLNGKRFQDVEEIQQNPTRQLFLMSEDGFKKDAWSSGNSMGLTVFASERDYLEGG